MKWIKLLAVCMTLVLFCTGVVGCTDMLEEPSSVTPTQNANASTTIRNATTTTTTTQPITTATTTTTTIRKTTTSTKKATTTTIKKATTSTRAPALPQETMVWIPTNGGTKYHRKSTCSKMIDPEYVTLSEAKALGFTACGRCY